MIFVTVGTQDKQFKRLISAIDKLKKSGKIPDEVIVQAGHTKYRSDDITILNYIPFDEFNSYLNKADIIITHGGVGSILNSVKLMKPVIAMPRLKKFGEHINDHQIQIIKKMEEEGYIISCFDENELEDKIALAREFKPNIFISNSKEFIKKFEKELNDII